MFSVAKNYLLLLYRYIELNPVRAGMIDDPADYSWSSYQCNVLGKRSDLLSLHGLYQALGNTAEGRQKTYRYFLKNQLENRLLENIRQSTN